jgi:hypothetical protein
MGVKEEFTGEAFWTNPNRMRNSLLIQVEKGRGGFMFRL